MTTHASPPTRDRDFVTAPRDPTAPSDVASAVAAMGPGPLTEASLIRHVHPLFSRVLGGGGARRELYLANHSLGRPLDQVSHDVARQIDAWHQDMDGAWATWSGSIARFRSLWARLLGLTRPDAVVPKASAGQALRAVLNAIPNPKDGKSLRIVASDAEFDSIEVILRTYQERGRAVVRFVPSDANGMINEGGCGGSGGGSIAAAIDDSTDVVIASQVYFQTGQVLEKLDAIAAKARACRAIFVLDMYHGAGVLPCPAFDALGCDFAIGGSYKYTRGGPGAGWLAIHPRHLIDDSTPTASTANALVTLDTGWFAKRDVFGFSRGERVDRAPGGDAWLECTPTVLAPAQALAGLELTLALGVDRLRAYSQSQQATLTHALQARGVPIAPPEPASRGAFLRVPAPRGDTTAFAAGLKSTPLGRWSGLNTDGRAGHIRLCPDILNTNEELDAAAEMVARAMRPC